MTLTFPVAVTHRSPQPLNPALPPSMSPELEEHSNIRVVNPKVPGKNSFVIDRDGCQMIHTA